MTKSSDRSADAAVQKAIILKALAHPLRIRMFEAVAEGEKTVSELVTITGDKEANVSRHLSVLRSTRLVTTRKEGLNVYYSNAMPCLISMLQCVNQALYTMADENMKIACCLKS